MSKYQTSVKRCEYYNSYVYKGVISKGNWKRILWQEFDTESDALEWANTVRKQEYRG